VSRNWLTQDPDISWRLERVDNFATKSHDLRPRFLPPSTNAHCLPVWVQQSCWITPFLHYPPYLQLQVQSTDWQPPSQAHPLNLCTNTPLCQYIISHGFFAFNRPVDHLPSDLTHLLLLEADRFTQPIDHLPSSLLVLHLGRCFNDPITHLPPKLQELVFHSFFNKPICNIPSFLKKFTLLESTYSHFVSLPPSLTHMTTNAPLVFFGGQLPTSLTHLQCSMDVSTNL